MRIAFIGGTRFIGHAAAAHAVARGHDVALIHRGSHACEVAGAREVLADRSDAAALRAALSELRPDVVVDTRAMTRADAAATVAALAPRPVPVVVLSSQDVYAQLGRLNGLAAPAPEPLVREDAALGVRYPFRGVGPHEGGDDYDKQDVEDTFRAAALPALAVLRLPATYGARDPRRRFGWLLDALDAGVRELPAEGRFRWTHAHVRDVAHAIVLAAERARTGVWNVGEAHPPTMRARAEGIAAAAGVTLRWVAGPVPPALALLGAQPNDFVADTARVRADLGYAEVTTATERMADLVDWLRRSRVQVRVVTTAAELEACLRLRREVFVVEQEVPEHEEIDGKDPECVHFLATVAGEPAGTARLWLHDGRAKAQRVAVRATARRSGLGRALMEALEREARARGASEVVLGAQVTALGFYERLGYRAEGPEFLDAGIAHRWMRRAV